MRTGEGPGGFGTWSAPSRGTCVVGGQGNANPRNAQRAVNVLPTRWHSPLRVSRRRVAPNRPRHGVCLTRYHEHQTVAHQVVPGAKGAESAPPRMARFGRAIRCSTGAERRTPSARPRAVPRSGPFWTRTSWWLPRRPWPPRRGSSLARSFRRRIRGRAGSKRRLLATRYGISRGSARMIFAAIAGSCGTWRRSPRTFSRAGFRAGSR